MPLRRGQWCPLGRPRRERSSINSRASFRHTESNSPASWWEPPSTWPAMRQATCMAPRCLWMGAPPPCFPSANSAAPSQSERDDEEIVSPLDPFPDVGQNETRRADQVRASSLPGGQGKHPDRGRGEAQARSDRGPAKHGRALQVEEDQDAAEKALAAGARAQLLGGPGGGARRPAASAASAASGSTGSRLVRAASYES